MNLLEQYKLRHGLYPEFLNELDFKYKQNKLDRMNGLFITFVYLFLVTSISLIYIFCNFSN